MAFITDILNTIKNARKGKDMRQAIYDGIQQCYKDATGHPDSVAAVVERLKIEKGRIDELATSQTFTGNYTQSNLVFHAYRNATTDDPDPDDSYNYEGTSGKHEMPICKIFQEGTLDFAEKQSNEKVKILKEGLYIFELRIFISGSGKLDIEARINDVSQRYNAWQIVAQSTEETKIIAYILYLKGDDVVSFYGTPGLQASVRAPVSDVNCYVLDWIGKAQISDCSKEISDIRVGEDGAVYGTAGEAVRKQIGNITEELSNLLEEGTQILDWKNAKVVNGYFTSISDFKSSDVSRTVIIPVDYSKGDTISIHRGIMGERFVYGYTSIEMPKIGDILDYANVQNNAERVTLRIKSDTKNILLYYYNSTLDNYDSYDILASIMVQYGKVYTGYEPYGEPRGKKDIINKINGNSEKLISAVYNSPSIFDDVSNPISKGDHFYLYVKDIVGAKYSDIEFYFFRSDNTYKRVIHNINIGELYAITADEDYTKYRIRIVVESTTSNDMIYAIYNIFQSNGISAINISAKVYDLALDNNKKVEQLTANNLNTCNIFRKVIACGDSYTAGYIVSKTGEIHNVNEEYAWPHYMETITGNTWVNCGHSGTNAYTWQTAERGLPKARAAGKAQAYILGLMINDSSSDSNRNLTLGTITDIGTNNMTFYAQYTKVIKELFNISPNAKVFIETCPKVEGDRYVGYNQAVHDIYDALKSNYPNLHLLDLFKYYNMYTNTSLANDSLAGHYTAIGYQQFAQILSVILSSYINEHISDFQDVAFIEYDN